MLPIPEEPIGSPSHSPNTITERMIVALEKTRPYVWLISFLGYSVSILALLMAVLILVTGVMAPEVIGGGGKAGFAALLYVVIGGIFFVPSLFLSQYGSQIAKIRPSSDRVPPLEEALELQRSFWRYVGVFAAITVVITLLLFSITVFMNVFSNPAAVQ